MAGALSHRLPFSTASLRSDLGGNAHGVIVLGGGVVWNMGVGLTAPCILYSPTKWGVHSTCLLLQTE